MSQALGPRVHIASSPRSLLPFLRRERGDETRVHKVTRKKSDMDEIPYTLFVSDPAATPDVRVVFHFMIFVSYEAVCF